VKELFSSRWWFRVPEYQRPYVWGPDEIGELLEDVTYAMTESRESEYFLGSLVFQSRKATPGNGQEYPENDILDGQQRMATLLILFAVLRDLATNPQAKTTCQACIYQEANPYTHIPERTRLVFAIRDKAQVFIDEYIKPEDGTARGKDLVHLTKEADDLSVRNMAQAIIEIRKFIQSSSIHSPELLLEYLINNVLLIYVSTEELDDAFRLFTILNDRGIPLRNSDILKALNLGALDNRDEKVKYAKSWEEAENELGDDFDRFLGYIRTILVKDKARLSLLQEFEDKIYDPKEKDKTTGQRKPTLLSKGRDTFDLIDRYLSHYSTILGGENYKRFGNNFQFDNLVQIMRASLPATDWWPPVLRFFDKFHDDRLLEFLTRLDNKFTVDWIGQYSPTDRIEAMNAVIKSIDNAVTVEDVFNSGCFQIDGVSFIRGVDGPVYGKRFANYLLLKLDYLYHNHYLRMNVDRLTVEHILPQDPENGSKWLSDFSSEQRVEWTNKLGNLVLITGRKNSSLGRLPYDQKKERYFKNKIDTCPNSLRVLQNYQTWTPIDLQENHTFVLKALREHYGLDTVVARGN
jgi:hypothetical protein